MSVEKKRTIVVGDIHGCYDELRELLKKINYSPIKDRLISLGDLVHKGPQSAEVLEFFYHNSLEVIMGNHDWHFLEALRGNCKMYPEAEAVLRRCNLSPKQLIRWMSTFPFYIKEKDFIAVHACFNPGVKKYSKTSHSDMISGRYYDTENKRIISNHKYPIPDHIKPWYQMYNPEKVKNRLVVFGHWAQPQPRFFKNFRCIDTGCCYGGRLSCLILPEDILIKVNSYQTKKFNY